MIKLTSNNVRTIFKKCLFSKDELTKEGLPDSPMIKVEAVSEIYGFRKESVDSVKDDIIELLMQLNEIFFKDIGGGDSFLNAVKNDRGLNWTKSQTDVELLLALGLAIGAITYSLPRNMWYILPGGLPYFTINLDKVDVISQYNEQDKFETVEIQVKNENEESNKAIMVLNSAISSLEETSKSLHKDLNSIIKLKKSTIGEFPEYSKMINNIKAKLKHNHDEIIRLQELLYKETSK